VVREHARPGLDLPVHPAGGKPQRVIVLVVDDEPDIRALVNMVLRSSGHTIIEADGGLAAIDALEQHDVDVMLLDVRMPDMNGWDVLERLEPRAERPRVVMVSAHVDALVRERARAAGCDGYLSKPFMPAELLATVQAVGGR
jgi:CheY-like chemotaxis protein